MFSARPRLQVVGRASRPRVRLRGDWDADPETNLRIACGTAVAMEKAVCEAIGRARRAGMTWDAIARTLGVADEAADRHALADAFGASRREILEYQLREAQ
jgi:hypothetical protein